MEKSEELAVVLLPELLILAVPVELVELAVSVVVPLLAAWLVLIQELSPIPIQPRE
jgi:hypothetical protein